MSEKIQPIDTSKFKGNQSAYELRDAPVPYSDIQAIADKMNEIVEFINNTFK